MDRFISWFQQLDFSVLYDYGIVVAASLLCIMFHEVSHGLTALALGDTTAKDAGRLTFNPLRHVDPWGLLMMAVFHFGWAKPVPVNMNRFKRPIIGMAITAAAGPISNLILAWLALAVRAGLLAVYYRSGGVFLHAVITFLEYTAVLSIGLAVFNVIPVPPLDGAKVLFAILPRNVYYKVLRYEKYGFLIMMVILFTGILDTPLMFCRSGLLNLLNSSTEFIYRAVTHLLY